jgi:hypothetical protein
MPMDGLEYGPALAIRLSDWLTLLSGFLPGFPLKNAPLLKNSAFIVRKLKRRVEEKVEETQVALKGKDSLHVRSLLTYICSITRFNAVLHVITQYYAL